MIRQIKYFHSVVKNNSFSEAAEECHISQSAISQQIQALENELGFKLLDRKNRKFELTPAGEYFYKRTLILIADFERIRNEALKLANDKNAKLYLGYLRSFAGVEFHSAVAEFSEKYPEVDIEMYSGNHEELYEMLTSGKIDLALNDQRRAFSDAYVNLILTTAEAYIEISSRNPIAGLDSVSPNDLKSIPCILVASKEQQKTEYDYYNRIIGIQSEILYAENLEEARLMVIGGKGFMPIEGKSYLESFGLPISRIPLANSGGQISRNYCAFWKKDNSGYYVEEFADILKKQFDN